MIICTVSTAHPDPSLCLAPYQDCLLLPPDLPPPPPPRRALALQRNGKKIR